MFYTGHIIALVEASNLSTHLSEAKASTKHLRPAPTNTSPIPLSHPTTQNFIFYLTNKKKLIFLSIIYIISEKNTVQVS